MWCIKPNASTNEITTCLDFKMDWWTLPSEILWEYRVDEASKFKFKRRTSLECSEYLGIRFRRKEFLWVYWVILSREIWSCEESMWVTFIEFNWERRILLRINWKVSWLLIDCYQYVRSICWRLIPSRRTHLLSLCSRNASQMFTSWIRK